MKKGMLYEQWEVIPSLENYKEDKEVKQGAGFC